jgi:hypothetical protein
VNSGDGWSRPEKLKPPPGPPPPGQPPPSATSRDGRKDAHHKGRKDSFLAHRLRSMKLPAETAAELAGKLTAVRQSGDEFTGDLTAEAAKELLAFGSHRRDGTHSPPEPVNPRGTVKYLVKDGMLQRLEIQLAATMTLNGTELVIDRTTEIVIKDAGATKIDVPAAAKQLLESDPTAETSQKHPA